MHSEIIAASRFSLSSETQTLQLFISYCQPGTRIGSSKYAENVVICTAELWQGERSFKSGYSFFPMVSMVILISEAPSFGWRQQGFAVCYGLVAVVVCVVTVLKFCYCLSNPIFEDDFC